MQITGKEKMMLTATGDGTDLDMRVPAMMLTVFSILKVDLQFSLWPQ